MPKTLQGKRINRHDAWTRGDDLVVVKTVVEHLKSGATQTDAFKSAARKLGRTPGAVGFRFNTVLRKEHEKSVNQAKQAKNILKYHNQPKNVEVPTVEVVKKQSVVEDTSTQLSLDLVEINRSDKPMGIGYEIATILTNYTFLENKVKALEAEIALLRSQKN